MLLINVRNCPDCGPLPKSHFEKYIESFSEYILPRLSGKWTDLGERMLVRILTALGLIKKTKDIPFNKISLRTSVFIWEGRKRGWEFRAFKGPAGFLNVFEMQAGGRKWFFEGLPIVKFPPRTLPLAKREGWVGDIDDKATVKRILLKNNLPASEGKSFWFFNRDKALEYGLRLGFPLAVKPRSGSMSHHVTMNIKNESELSMAIKKAVKYEPTFIVEKYLAGTNVYRATVVGKDRVACVHRVPANVAGDGVHNVGQLIEIKNQDPKRGLPRQKDTTLYRIVIDEISQRLIKEQGFSFDDVVPAGKRVFLQEKVILDLGADLLEVTGQIHQDNFVLFKKIAEIFGINLVGIDFLAEDISRSWKEQKCGIIELNSLPYIDMHHFPLLGKPVNVAGWLCDMVEASFMRPE